MNKLRELKKKRLLQGGKSTDNLIGNDDNQDSPGKGQSDDEEPVKESEEEFTGEDESQLEAMESPTHYYQCPVFQTTLRLAKHMEY